MPSKRKLKAVPGAYRAARKASWGGLWPDWLSRTRRGLADGEQRRVRRGKLVSVSADGEGASGEGAARGAVTIDAQSQPVRRRRHSRP